MVGDADGALAVGVARLAAVTATARPARTVPVGPLPAWFDQPRGVFVTLKIEPGDRLRGCIGYPRPMLPLRTALVEAARGAAVHDPRFPPLEAREVASLRVEVSLLTVPEPVPSDATGPLLTEIEPGRHGLIVDAPQGSGLLLPQVAAEEGWSTEEFLAATCEKAGLLPSAWRSRAVRVLRFEAEVFAEASPAGEVVRLRPAAGPSDGGPAPRSGGPRTPTSRPRAPPRGPPPSA